LLDGRHKIIAMYQCPLTREKVQKALAKQYPNKGGQNRCSELEPVTPHKPD